MLDANQYTEKHRNKCEFCGIRGHDRPECRLYLGVLELGTMRAQVSYIGKHMMRGIDLYDQAMRRGRHQGRLHNQQQNQHHHHQPQQQQQLQEQQQQQQQQGEQRQQQPQ
ncbi:hypothetical protein CBS63078_10139 [Aspergillus niger]|nr:hypothetical protein CBS115989_3661 [Aspergillus niger]KAI2837613.1 hypothetical protein CBS11350_8653 [Aspergillus niger]KAI2843840.1 hypothetical protein CBS11232_8143 [Aspergillus niger]KAI2871407.1 hypothetical protein CBS115988_8615 [Aspergillus niger]KAI2883704.1 hypothetical protein CBS13152_8307 [Aspergillus niger]